MNPFRCPGQSAILILLCVTNMLAAPRTWTSVDGRTLEAEYIRAEGDVIMLRRAGDGHIFTVPLSRLSEADRVYVAEQKSSKGSRTSAVFPEGGLQWPRQTEPPGAFEVDILEEDNMRDLYRYRAGHFVFTSDVRLSRKVVADFAEVFEGTYGAVQAMPLAFQIEAPEEGYDVRIFAERGNYEAAGGLVGSGGVYMPGQRLMLVPTESLGLKKSSSGVTLDGTSHGTLIHEITHQVQHDWLGRMPVWMSEGFAEYVEAVPYRNGRFYFSKIEPDAMLKSETYSTDEFAMTQLEQLMTMSGQDWNQVLARDSYAARRQYRSAFFLIYYFIHLDGEGDGRRLWEALRILERTRTYEEWLAAQDQAREVLLGGRSYDELFKDMQRAYRSEGIKLLGGR